jgi:VanZ family protein
MPSVMEWRWLLAVAMLALLVLSLMPPSPHMPTTGWDKSNHMLGFAVLAVLGHAAWPLRTMSVLVGLLAYGGLIEVLQSFTPDRFAEWGDLLADGVGLLIGKGCALLLMRRHVSPE